MKKVISLALISSVLFVKSANLQKHYLLEQSNGVHKIDILKDPDYDGNKITFALFMYGIKSYEIDKSIISIL